MKSPIFIVIGIIFAPIAGILAFIISFEEYKHHYTNIKDSLKIPLQIALITFLFFIFIFLILSFFRV
ncbi:hypothetical protein M1145_03575 [Patescibacteria group bacterium]|nr:hypothetical protein [Patescibacteria group bacterium]